MNARALVLVLLAGCKVVGGSGAGDQPELGQRYSCAVDRSCYPERSVVSSSPCATSSGDAELGALEAAACSGCACVVTCTRRTPPRLCSVRPDAIPLDADPGGL